MAVSARADLSQKSGISSSSPTWVQDPQRLGPSSATFPDDKQGAETDLEQLKQGPACIQDASIACGELDRQATILAPFKHSLIVMLLFISIIFLS